MKKLKSLEIPGTGYKFFMDNAECAPNALEKIQSLINSLTEEAKELKSEATKDNTAKIQCLNLVSYCLYQVSKTLIKGISITTMKTPRHLKKKIAMKNSMKISLLVRVTLPSMLWVNRQASDHLLNRTIRQ